MKKTNKLLAMLAIAVATLVPFKSFAQQSAVPQQVAEMYPAAATVNDLGAWSAVLDNAGAVLAGDDRDAGRRRQRDVLVTAEVFQPQG